MSIDAKEIQGLISEGDYWDALDLEPGTPSNEIIMRVIILSEEYPSLATQLNRVQTALTKELDLYNRARGTRDQALIKIENKYGPGILQMERETNGACHSLRAALWRPLAHEMTDPSKAFSNMEQIAITFEKEIDHTVSLLPSLSITYLHYREREIRCQMVRQDCSSCNGKREVTCPICKGSGKVDRVTGFPLRLWDASYGLVACHECNGTGKIRCQCVMDATISIPKGVKPGWVVESNMKSQGGHSEKSYARLDFSWGQLTSEFMLANLAKGWINIHPLTPSGQALMLTIGIIALFSNSLDQYTFLLLLKAGFRGIGQGIGQGISAINNLITSPSSVSALPIDPLAIEGLILMQGVILILLPLTIFLRRILANSGQWASFDLTAALFFTTFQFLTSRWILGLLSSLVCLTGLSSISLAIIWANIGLGFIGTYSLIVGGVILTAVLKTFSQD